jgi:O-6-methylguanine DNA methyltransferase
VNPYTLITGKEAQLLNVWGMNSILGTFRLEEENDAICGLTLCPDGVPELEPLPRKVCETPLLQEAEEQLNEYIAGARREFDLPLAPKGTPFQKAVWAEMNKIPYGETRTYGQLAAAIGKPKASRAVSGACHCNPIRHPSALPPGGGQHRQAHRLRL